MKKKQLTAYDTIFQFLFQSSPRGKPSSRPGEPYSSGLTGLAGGLQEIAVRPAVYPFEIAMKEIGDELDDAVTMYEIEPVEG